MKAKPFEVRFSLRGTSLPLAYIQARFYEHGQRTNTIATGYKISLCEWNEHTSSPKHGCRPDIAHGLMELRNSYMMLYLTDPKAGIDKLRKNVLTRDAIKRNTVSSVSDVVSQMLQLKEDDYANGKLKVGSIKKNRNYAAKMAKCFQKIGIVTLAADDFTMKHALLVENYFRATAKMEHNCASKILQWLRSAFRHAQALGTCTRNGMCGLKLLSKSKEINTLNNEELSKIENVQLNGTLEKVRNLFLLQAYTGLNITDVYLLKKEEVIIVDGHPFITIVRTKTPILARAQLVQLVWLQPKAMAILEEWGWNIFKISGQKANPYLRSIEMAIGARCTITTKVARSTFAQLMYDVLPKEVVQRMLGHQQGGMMERHYAKVSAKKIVLELKKSGLIE